MPGAIGEQIGRWNGNILKTAMMRGSFILRRDIINAVARNHPEEDPWPRDFTFWSNVPFFASALESGQSFGYLMTGDSVVVHDDRPDELAMGTHFPGRAVETLKSLVLLLYRNRLFEYQSFEINQRLLDFNEHTIRQVAGLNETDAARMQDHLIQIANIINESISCDELIRNFEEIKKDIPDVLLTFCEGVIDRINDEESFGRIKKLVSLSVKRPMYEV